MTGRLVSVLRGAGLLDEAIVQAHPAHGLAKQEFTIPLYPHIIV